MLATDYPAGKTSASKKRLFFMLFQDIAARADLSSSAKVVLGAIVYRIGKNESCYPSVKDLGKMTGLCLDTVNQSTRALEKAGMIQIEHGGFRKANRYRLGPAYVLKSGTCGKSDHAEMPSHDVLETSTSMYRKSVTNQKEPLKRTTTGPAAPAVAVEGSSSEARKKQKNAETILRRIGVASRAARELSEREGMSGANIVRAAQKAPKIVRNLPGWLLTVLREKPVPSTDGLSPREATEGIKRRWIMRIGTFDLPQGTKAGHNAEGLMLMYPDGRQQSLLPSKLRQVDVS